MARNSKQDDPLAKQSRFHRVRIATTSGELALPAVLTQLLEKGRKNVLIVPAVFCADGALDARAAALHRWWDDKMRDYFVPVQFGCLTLPSMPKAQFCSANQFLPE